MNAGMRTRSRSRGRRDHQTAQVSGPVTVQQVTVVQSQQEKPIGTLQDATPIPEKEGPGPEAGQQELALQSPEGKPRDDSEVKKVSPICLQPITVPDPGKRQPQL